MIFPITVDAINGLRGTIAAGKHARRGDPGYYRAIYLIQEIQGSGNLSMRIVKGKDDKETICLFFYHQDLSPESKKAIEELIRLLRLRPGSNEFKVVYGIIPETDQELAIQTRSMLQIMIVLAAQIDIPPAHVEEGRAMATLMPPEGEESRMGRLIKIRNTFGKPKNDFVSVKYKDHWFWIDDRDFHSKRTFAFLMVLFSLTESGGKGGLPLVTIPAG